MAEDAIDPISETRRAERPVRPPMSRGDGGHDPDTSGQRPSCRTPFCGHGRCHQFQPGSRADSRYPHRSARMTAFRRQTSRRRRAARRGKAKRETEEALRYVLRPSPAGAYDRSRHLRRPRVRARVEALQRHDPDYQFEQSDLGANSGPRQRLPRSTGQFSTPAGLRTPAGCRATIQKRFNRPWTRWPRSTSMPAPPPASITRLPVQRAGRSIVRRPWPWWMRNRLRTRRWRPPRLAIRSSWVP